MKITVFDVSNGDCSLVVCPNGYGMMIDCGNHTEKDCPVDVIKENDYNLVNWSQYKKYDDNYGLTLLHITHPDYDHIKNAEKVVEELKPKLMQKRDYDSEFPEDIHKDIDEGYKKNVCKQYRGKEHNTKPNWGFSNGSGVTFRIPMKDILNNEDLKGTPKNNSSIIRIIEYGGRKVLFGGDMEEAGWDWLIENDDKFFKEVYQGIDIFLAPHHGHKSGFSRTLFEVMGRPYTILSKGSEAEKEGTDVSSQYSALSSAIPYVTLKDNENKESNILTTRKNGHIFISVDENGEINFITQR